MFTRRVRRYLLMGCFGLAGAALSPAQNLTSPRGAPPARTRPVTRRPTLDEFLHHLNTATGDAMLHVREIDRGRLLIVRGLTNDFTQPYTGKVTTLSKQQLRWLTAGVSILTNEAKPEGTKTQELPEGTNTEKNLDKFTRDLEAYVAAGGDPYDFLYDHLGSSGSTEDPPPDASDSWYKNLVPDVSRLMPDLFRAGDAAQSETLKIYVDYFDAHWDELSEYQKCCIPKRLNEARPGLPNPPGFTYEEFKNRLKFPKDYPKDGLTPQERGKLIVTLTECIPVEGLKEVRDALGMAARYAKAAELAKKLVRDGSIKVFDAAMGLGTAATKAKNFVVEWATGGSEGEKEEDDFDFGDGFGFDGPGGPNEQSARRAAPAVHPAKSSNADVVVVLKPRQPDLPSMWVALRIEAGRITIPEPYAGTYDIYLYRPGLAPGFIRAVPTDSVRPKLLRVQTPRALAPSRNAPFRATVNPAPDRPPEAPAFPPLQGCPCKPYRILVTSQATCRPAGTPLLYSNISFEGQAIFDVFDKDYQFPAGISTRYLKPILLPMHSKRQFWQGEMDGAAFSKAPASLVMNGDLSIKIELNKQPRGQPDQICLNLDVDYARNPKVPVRNSIRDIRTGHVTSGTIEESMFGPGLNNPFGMHGKGGCGFPGRVAIRADSSAWPAELLTGCSYVTQVIIEPLDESSPTPSVPTLPSPPPPSLPPPPTGPTSPPTSTGTPREPGTNRPGGDYRGFEMPRADPAACQAACGGESQCTSWTYVKPGIQGDKAHCWLKDSVMRAYPDECCVSGAKGAAVVAPMAQASLEVNTRRDGGDYRQIQMASTYPNACQSACESEARCKAWTFVKPDAPGSMGTCWLKSSVPPKSADPRGFSGVKGAAR